MKFLFIFLSAISFFNSKQKTENFILKMPGVTRHLTIGESDTSQLLYITNNSSLKRLPAVLKDLSLALRESSFNLDGLLGKFEFRIDVQDFNSKDFGTAATVLYHPGDPVFYLQLNKLNKYASDRALAATLIHELMHCILLSIDQKARKGNEIALSFIKEFNQKIRDPFGYSVNNFYDLMNRHGEGQHELMYQLFYPSMVSLLERFMQIHRLPFWHHEDAESLMWSGLQGTRAYQDLSYEEQMQVELIILSEKGIDVTSSSY